MIELIEDPRRLEQRDQAAQLVDGPHGQGGSSGPSVAGILVIYAVGEGACFLIDGFSYAAVLGALLLMRLRSQVLPANHPPAWHALREGVKYAAGFAPIRTLLLFAAVVSVMSMSQSTLMPIYANQILGGRARTFGLLPQRIRLREPLLKGACIWLRGKRCSVWAG